MLTEVDGNIVHLVQHLLSTGSINLVPIIAGSVIIFVISSLPLIWL